MTDSVARKRIDPAGEPIMASAWRNLYFLKDGRSFLGDGQFSTEQEAHNMACARIAEDQRDSEYAAQLGKRLSVRWPHVPIKYFYEDFSHHIQVPVKP